VAPALRIGSDVDNIEHVKHVRISQDTLPLVHISHDDAKCTLPKSRRNCLRLSKPRTINDKFRLHCRQATRLQPETDSSQIRRPTFFVGRETLTLCGLLRPKPSSSSRPTAAIAQPPPQTAVPSSLPPTNSQASPIATYRPCRERLVGPDPFGFYGVVALGGRFRGKEKSRDRSAFELGTGKPNSLMRGN
jgi:hypothetical protein